jgi:hypothetical protein
MEGFVSLYNIIHFLLSLDTIHPMMSCRMMHRSSGRNNFGLSKDDDRKESTKSSASSKLTAEEKKQIDEKTNAAIAAAQASNKNDTTK